MSSISFSVSSAKSMTLMESGLSLSFIFRCPCLSIGNVQSARVLSIPARGSEWHSTITCTSAGRTTRASVTPITDCRSLGDDGWRHDPDTEHWLQRPRTSPVITGGHSALVMQRWPFIDIPGRDTGLAMMSCMSSL